MEHGGAEAEATQAYNGFCFGWDTTVTTTEALDERQSKFMGMYADPTPWDIPSVYHILDLINNTDEIWCTEWLFTSGGSSLSPLKQIIKPKNLESLLPDLAILDLYETTPIRSLGRLTEAYILTRQPRVDRTISVTSRVSSQGTGSTSNQAQPPRNNPRSEELTPNHQCRTTAGTAGTGSLRTSGFPT